MTKKFIDLDVAEIKNAINRTGTASNLVIKDEVFIPEADILICEYKNTRVNIKVDLAYGANIEPVGRLAETDVDEIKELIMKNIDLHRPET